jgi:uncharacterized protein
VANPFVHVELNTQNPEAAKRFYGSLFDWTLEDIPMPTGNYTLIKPGAGTGGGIMKHPMPGSPSTWLAYVQVDDIKAFTEKARSLGAIIIVECQNVPNFGSFSIFTDPAGALLALWMPLA